MLSSGGLHFSNYVSSLDAEEMRAADGSTLTIEFSDAQVDGPDIVLDLAAGDPPPQLGDWQGERFESSSDSAKTVAVLYRTPLGAESFLQYGWWQTEMTSSSGRRWFDRHGQFVSARGEIAGVRNIAELQGQATFEGHAAGIYAISNPREGQNDSGEFVAPIGEGERRQYSPYRTAERKGAATFAAAPVVGRFGGEGPRSPAPSGITLLLVGAERADHAADHA